MKVMLFESPFSFEVQSHKIVTEIALIGPRFG